jgi:hypothetical protein
MGAILSSLKSRLSSVELLAHTPCGGPTPGGLTIIVCTSTTRPGSPATGQVIYETDTDSLLVWNGAAWVVFADEQLLTLDTANSRIGINDSTPSFALDVTGDIRATGTIYADGTIVFEGATADANETTLTVIDPTADRTISLPNASGNVALTSSTTGVITLGTDTAGNYVSSITAGTGITVTGTPGEGWSPTVASTSGLIRILSQTIGTGVTSIPVTGAFSATYDAYRIIITGGTISAAGSVTMTLGASAASYYYGATLVTYSTGAVTGTAGNNVANWVIGMANTNNICVVVDVVNPNLAKPTSFGSFDSNGISQARQWAGYHNVATSYTDFTIGRTGAGSYTGGEIVVYGYTM